jgi:exodeoxyribonuclease III
MTSDSSFSKGEAAFTVAAWNVNSLKARLDHLLGWLATAKPDVVCLQELKCESAMVPIDKLRDAGYEACVNGQKTYNGVAILSRYPIRDVVADMAGYDDSQKRVIAATIASPVGDVRVMSVYCVNGEAVGSEKYEYKLRWYEHLYRTLKDEVAKHPQLVVAGDYNIAPDDRDVRHTEEWAGKVLCSEPEREIFRKLLALGLHDSFRCFDQPEKTFSWWDYRMLAFRRNNGLRIDHLLISDALKVKLVSSLVDKEPRKLEKPSDHAPVVAAFGKQS